MGTRYRTHLSPTGAALLLVIVAAFLTLPADPAFGQGGTVMLYSDSAYTSCNLVPAPGIVHVYIVHRGASISSIQFALRNVGHNLVFVTDVINPPNVWVGLDSQRGMAVGHLGCQGPPWLISDTWYEDVGTPSPACSYIEVVPDPADPTGQVSASACPPHIMVFPDTSKLTINGDGSCACGAIVPVEPTTWGRVKALY